MIKLRKIIPSTLLLAMGLTATLTSETHAAIKADWMQSKWGISYRISGGDETLNGKHSVTKYKSRVADYDVEAAVEQLAAIPGLDWVQINITNGAFGDRFIAPLDIIEQINPLSTPSRDLFGELATALQAKNIKVVAYVATQGPAMMKHGALKALDYDPSIPNCKKRKPTVSDPDTRVYCSANMNRWRDKVLDLYPGDETLYRKFEIAMAEQVVGEFARQYGNKIDGWWFDHSENGGDKTLLKSAVLSGNSQAIMTFNEGEKIPLTNNSPGYEDFTFGHPTPMVKAVASSDVNLPMIETLENSGAILYGPNGEPSLGHIFPPMQEQWTTRDVVFSEAKASEWLQRLNNVGGALTWAVALNNGQPNLVHQPQVSLMARAQLNIDKQLDLRFEGQNDQTTYDNAINRYSASVSGATFVNDPVRGKVIKLSSEDTVTVDDYKGVEGTAARTVMAWIKTTDKSGKLIEWGANKQGQHWQVGISSGKPVLSVHGTNVFSSIAVNDNQWHHLAIVVADDMASAQVYVDGVEDQQVKFSGAMNFNTTPDEDVKIGRDFSGLLDQLTVHERSLSAKEIAYVIDDDKDLELALNLSMDEAYGAKKIHDQSIYGRIGSIVGPTAGSIDAKRGAVVSFSGKGKIVMNASIAKSAAAKGYNGVPGTDPRTVMAWIKTNDNSGVITQWGNINPVNGERWLVRIQAGNLQLAVQGGNVTGTTLLNDGQWHHVAIVAPDNQLDNIKMYVDGILETSSQAGAQLNFNTFTLSSTATIANGRDVEIGNGYIGEMDDLIIHQRALWNYEVASAAEQ